jgi:hypothetical protein
MADHYNKKGRAPQFSTAFLVCKTGKLSADFKHLGPAFRAGTFGGFSAVFQGNRFGPLHGLFLFAFYAVTFHLRHSYTSFIVSLPNCFRVAVILR